MAFDWTPRRRLILSLALAVIAGGGSWVHLDGRRRVMEEGTRMVETMVARRYIPAGKSVPAEAVERRRVPAAYVEPGALTGEKGMGAGVRARIAILKGEQITRSKVELPGALPGLAWIVASTERAVGLRLPPENAVGGLVLPGDRVDLLSVRRDMPEAVVLARQVRVLSVGDRLWDAAEAASPIGNAAAADSLLLTVALSPSATARVAAASQTSSIVLALVSPIAGEEAP